MSPTALGTHASHHLGPVHAFMLHTMHVPAGVTTFLAGAVLVLIVLGMIVAGLKRVFA